MLSERKQKEHWVRILEALGKIGDPAASPAVRPFLRDAGERRRIQAIAALAALKDTVSAGAIAERLDDALLTVRSAASAALVSLGAPAAGPLLARLDRASAHRPLTLRTLGRLATALAAKPEATGRRDAHRIARVLLAEVQDPARASAADAECRAAAVEALLGLEIPEIADALRARIALEDDPLVRRTYEWGLARAKR
jgi:HEAT repeat protein